MPGRMMKNMTDETAAAMSGPASVASATDWAEETPDWTSARASDPLDLRRGPFRMMSSRRPWLATGYLASYPIIGGIAFAISVALLGTTAAVIVTWLGLPLLVGVAAILHGIATVERHRTALVGAVISARYRPVKGTGVLAHVRARWRDRATYRECGYLVGLFIPLLILDVVALTLWLICLAGVTLPAWYWSVRFQYHHQGPVLHGVPIGYLPNGPGPGGFGVWIGSPLAAIIAAIVFAAISVAMAYVVVGAAITHRAVARRLLGPYVDPLAEAKNVLAAPGPLPVFQRNGGS